LMVELAEIFRLPGPDYRAKFGTRMLPSHHRAMQDIEQCRTAARGGQLSISASSARSSATVITPALW